jgi:hypothetical protein
MLRQIAVKHGVDGSALGGRWRSVTRSKEEGYVKQQALSPQQEIEPVRYTATLTKRGPTHKRYD